MYTARWWVRVDRRTAQHLPYRVGVLLVATIQQTPPDHRGGYDLKRDTLVEPCTDYHQARQALRERVPEGWRIVALRTAPDDTPRT